MFGIGLPELIIILIVALLVVGPAKLPEIARSLGRALGDFRRMADDVKETIEQDLYKDEDEKVASKEQVKKSEGVEGINGPGPTTNLEEPGQPLGQEEEREKTEGEGVRPDEKKSV